MQCFAQLDEWLARQRDQLRADWRRAARAQADVLERAGQATQAFALLRQQLHDELLAEDTLQALLRAAPAVGERAAALALFQRFCVSAAEILGLPPMPQTLALAEQLRRPAAVPSVMWPQALRRPPLLGRQAPLALLAARRATLWVVQGEPGISKTSLIRAALAGRKAGAKAGAAALWIAASDVLQPAPLQALAVALAAHMDTVRELGLAQGQRLELARLLPALADGERPPPPEQARGLHGAAVLVLQRCPAPGVIDDLQWLDADTVAVLADALAHADRHWLATLRPSEPAAAVREWLSSFDAAPASTLCDLQPRQHLRRRIAIGAQHQPFAGGGVRRRQVRQHEHVRHPDAESPRLRGGQRFAQFA